MQIQSAPVSGRFFVFHKKRQRIQRKQRIARTRCLVVSVVSLCEILPSLGFIRNKFFLKITTVNLKQDWLKFLFYLHAQ